MYGFDYWSADITNDEHVGVVYYWNTFEQTHVCRETQCMFIWDGSFDMSSSHHKAMDIEEVYAHGCMTGYDLRTSWTYGWRRWPALSDSFQKAFRDGWLDGRDNGLRDKRPLRSA